MAISKQLLVPTPQHAKANKDYTDLPVIGTYSIMIAAACAYRR